MTITIRHIAIFSACLAFFLSGCDPVSRHKVLTTIFEGVPSPPPAEDLCAEYAEKQVAALRDELAGKKTAAKEKETSSVKVVSIHLPYEEKQCDDCHDKSKEGGLVRPKKELCGMCHTDLIKGAHVHGPTAVGECLACHLPHTSAFSSLLKFDVSELCTACHREKRLAEEMHVKVGAKQLECVDCHDPHSGNSPYFLK